MEDRTNAIKLNDKDNVVTVINAINKGDKVIYVDNGQEITLGSFGCPCYHKVAAVDIPAGSKIYKFGEVIALASCDIRAGEHVHIHNMTKLN